MDLSHKPHLSVMASATMLSVLFRIEFKHSRSCFLTHEFSVKDQLTPAFNYISANSCFKLLASLAISSFSSSKCRKKSSVRANHNSQCARWQQVSHVFMWSTRLVMSTSMVEAVVHCKVAVRPSCQLLSYGAMAIVAHPCGTRYKCSEKAWERPHFPDATHSWSCGCCCTWHGFHQLQWLDQIISLPRMLFTF